ncbi:MAG: SNF2-related protein [Rubrivivax sp.]
MAHLSLVPRCALWAKPGMGKTSITMTFLDHLHNVVGEDAPTLVLAPLRVARDTWANEASKWEHLSDMRVVPVVGDVKQRTAALRQDAQVFTTNYEQLPWLVETLAGRWPFKTVIADESTKLKGFRLRQGGQRAQALARVAHKHAERWVNLTGTPASNGLEDLWGQTWFLDAGQRLGRTFSAFRERWFVPMRTGNAGFHQWRAAEFAGDEIHARLADICLTLDPKDWFDLKDPIVNVIEVELPPSARAKYREMERELFTMIGATEVEAMTAAAKYGKCLQMAAGAVFLEDGATWVKVHDEKLDALQELVEATGDDPLLVAYHYTHELARIVERFPDALNLANARDLAAAQAGKGKLWLGHPASMGHGVDGLQEHCNTVVFFAQDPNLEYHDQILERVGPMRQFQAGKDRPVFLHYLVARGTIDELEMSRRQTKRSVQDALLEYMKGKR